MSQLDLRPWERYWEEKWHGKGFLRKNQQALHPSRFVIANLASKHETVLECGCATAIDSVYHQDLGTKYTGIDITPKFVAEAQEYNPGVDVRVGNLFDLEFPDRSKDTVYCRAVLEHTHPLEWPLGVKEMWRVADKQMILAFFGWHKKPHPDGSILDRMKYHVPPTTAWSQRQRPAARNHALRHPDIIDVIEKYLPGSKAWSMRILPAVKRKFKRYVLYEVTRL